MLRRLTKDAGRFKAGVLHDWPLATWNGVAKDAGFKSMDDFSEPAQAAEALQGPRKKGGVERPGLQRTRH